MPRDLAPSRTQRHRMHERVDRPAGCFPGLTIVRINAGGATGKFPLTGIQRITLKKFLFTLKEWQTGSILQ